MNSVKRQVRDQIVAQFKLEVRRRIARWRHDHGRETPAVVAQVWIQVWMQAEEELR